MTAARGGVKLAVAALAGVLLSGVVGRAQQPPLPAARDIVARNVEAIGGEAAYRSVHSVRARGRFDIPAQGISGTLEVLSARPAKLLYRVDVAGIGRIENGYDGKTAWSVSPISGPELLAGKQLSEAADDAWFDAPLHAPDHVRQLTTLDRTEFDGHAAYRVKVVFVSGNEQVDIYDADTGLEIGVQATRTVPQGPIPTVNILRNYQKFGPLLQATTMLQRALGFEQVVTITSCEYNVVADDAFDPPAEIRALMKTQ